MEFKLSEKRRAWDRKYYSRPEVKAKAKIKNYYNKLRRLFGLTKEDHSKMLEQQNNSCKICKLDNSGRKGSPKLCVDHCHKTNKVRGLLCYHCNQGLGHYKDSPELLREAAIYLETFNEKQEQTN